MEHHERASTTLAGRIQERLMMLYGVEAPSIEDFVRPSDDGRERVEVREEHDALEIAVFLPEEALRDDASVSLDVYCQVAEGVSHFLYLIERVRRGVPATQLELELQAEVDKFVVVTNASRRSPATTLGRIRERLFERIGFLHPEGSELGERYRLAHRLASRFVRRLEPELHARTDFSLRTLRRFFEAAQREKIEMALAA